MVVDWLVPAVEEAHEAYLWYRDRDVRAAEGFLFELDHAVEAIAGHPERYPDSLHRTKRIVMRRYPYIVVYRIEGDRVVVVAVQHGRREPGYWKGRL